MPIYEYECLQCGKNMEAIQKFSDAPLTTCPDCGGQMKKLISNTSFVLKGSGWYVTDYARKSAGSEKSASDKKTSGTKPESTTESKPETKTETKKEPVAAK
ncbi:MAG: zinc ribbon domain-containing protein [Nitrospirae bacterium]|nr:zinc ribbon domain-containing protein [Nitrospirota bacterium]